MKIHDEGKICCLGIMGHLTWAWCEEVFNFFQLEAKVFQVLFLSGTIQAVVVWYLAIISNFPSHRRNQVPSHSFMM